MNTLIKEERKKALYHAETYAPIETRIDSAFTPFDDPIFYKKSLNICKLALEIEEYNRNMKNAKSHMAIWDIPYQTAFGKNEYQEAKNEYEKNAEKKKNAEEQVMKLAENLKDMLEKEKQFIGFKAQHRYRANNNAGQTVFGKTEYLFDKDISKILNTYDMDNEEYIAVHFLYQQIIGEDMTFDNNGFIEEQN